MAVSMRDEGFDPDIVEVIIANLYTVNQLNNWSDSVASGFELTVKNNKQIEETYLNVLGTTRHMVDKEQNQYATFTIQELYAQIFEWLKLLDLNIWVILILMVCVASFTMISGLLILILEKTNTIGILKSLGSSNHLVRNIFLNYAILLMGRGIIIGNIVGLGLAFIQQKTGIITLNAENYYVDSVPIALTGRIRETRKLGPMRASVQTVIVPRLISMIAGRLNAIGTLST